MMSNKRTYQITGAILFIIGLFLIFYPNKNKVEITDAEKFASEYTTVSSDNVFVYKDIDEIINIMEHGTGIVYLGFPECKWCQAYVKYLQECAKEVGINKIYYYNILEDRTNNTEEYQKILSLLGENLQYDEEGNSRVFVPNVSFHINGEVIGNDYETSLDTHELENPEEYWTEEEVTDLKNKLIPLMKDIYKELTTCTSCNK